MDHKQEKIEIRERMNCAQAEIAMLKHMERTIAPEDVRRLSQHVTECEHCRESYLMFDEVMEFAATSTAADWKDTPVNFTAAVMADVRNMNIYAKQAAPQAANKSYIVLHILWGLSTVFLVAALFFAYNPSALDNLANAHPVLGGFVYIMNGVGIMLGSMLDAIVQSFGTLTIGNSLSIAALLFVLMLGSLLVVLHREDEKGIA